MSKVCQKKLVSLTPLHLKTRTLWGIKTTQSIVYGRSEHRYVCFDDGREDGNNDKIWLDSLFLNLKKFGYPLRDILNYLKKIVYTCCQKKLVSLTPRHLQSEHFLSLKTTQAIVYGHSERGYVCFSAHRSRSVCVLILKYHDLSCNITWLCVFFCSPICKT